MPTRPTFRAYVLLCAAVALSACESTAPNLDSILDTDAALADYDAVDSLLASPDWQAFAALGGRTPFSAGPAGVEAIAALDALGSSHGNRAFAVRLADRLASRAAATAPAAAPIISGAHRGATFIYDPDADEYVVDPERAGAPANGVRFVLYDVDLAGTPVLAEEIGHADLVDEGDASAEDVALRLTVEVNGHTALDYRTTVDIGLIWAEVTVDGFLADADGTQLHFDIAARGTQGVGGGTLDVTFDLGIESRGFSVSGSVSGVEDGEEGHGDVELAVTHRGHTLEVDMSGADGLLDGSIYLDGGLFATVTGDADNPTILSADGDPLTLSEGIALRRVIDVVEDVFDFLEDLVDPVDELVLVGILL